MLSILRNYISSTFFWVMKGQKIIRNVVTPILAERIQELIFAQAYEIDINT